MLVIQLFGSLTSSICLKAAFLPESLSKYELSTYMTYIKIVVISIRDEGAVTLQHSFVAYYVKH